MSECLWDIKALYAFVWTMCVCVWAQTNIYAHTLMLVKEQGLFTHRLFSSETDGMSRPAHGGTVAPPNGRLTACSTSPNVSFSLSSPKASAHLDSCHAKTRLSQNHTPSVFPEISFFHVSRLNPYSQMQNRKHLADFYLQIVLIRMPATLLA